MPVKKFYKKDLGFNSKHLTRQELDVYNGLTDRARKYFISLYDEESQIGDLFGDMASPIDVRSLLIKAASQDKVSSQTHRDKEFDSLIESAQRKDKLTKYKTNLSHTEAEKKVNSADTLFEVRRMKGIARKKREVRKAKKQERVAAYKAKSREREKLRKEVPKEELSFGTLFERINKPKKDHPNKIRQRALREKRVEEVRSRVASISEKKRLKKQAKRDRRTGDVKLESHILIETYMSEDLFQQDNLKSLLGDTFSLFNDLGSVSVLSYQFIRSRNFADVAAALYQFCKPLLPVVKLDKISDVIFDFARHVFDFCKKHNFWSYVKTESGLLDAPMSFWNTLVESDLVNSFQTFLVALTSLKLFGVHENYYLKKLFGTGKNMSLIMLITSGLKFLQSAFGFAERLWSGKPLTEALFADDPVNNIVERMNQHNMYADYLYTGLPVEGKMCIKVFISEGEAMVKEADEYLQVLNPYSSQTRALKGARLALLRSVIPAKTTGRGGTRPMPIGVILHGRPGVGKGKVIPFIVATQREVKGVGFKDTQIFNRKPDVRHWDGYDPNSHPAIFYSEVGNKNASQIQREGDKTITEINSLMDTMPYSCEMAFSDKGKIFAAPEIVVIDTNNPTLNLDLLISNASAIKRRFIFIEQRVKEEFRSQDGSCGIDFAKSMNSSNDFMDKWTFTVTEEKPVDNKATIKTVTHCDDIFALKRLLKERFTKHIQEQEDARNALYTSSVFNDLPEVREETSESESITESGYAEISCFSSFTSPIVRKCIEWKLESHYGDLVDYTRVSSRTFYQLFVTLLQYLIIQFLLFNYDGVSKSPVSYGRLAFILPLVYLGYMGSVPSIFLTLVMFLSINASFVADYIVSRKIEEILIKKKYELRFKYNQFLQAIGARVELFPKYLNFDSFYVKALAGISVLLGMCYIYMNYLKVKKIAESETSEFRTPSSVNEWANDFEKSYHCGKSYKRYANKIDGATWNIKVNRDVSAFTGDPASLHNVVASNIRWCRFIHGRVNRVGHIFGLRNNYAIVNAHSLVGLGKDLRIEVSTNGVLGDKNLAKRITLLDNNNVQIIGNDLAIIRLNEIRFKDIVHHIGRSKDVPEYTRGFLRTDNITTVLCKTPMHVFDKSGEDVSIDEYFIYNYEKHADGLCGVPLILRTVNGSSVYGMHSAGQVKGKGGYGAMFSRELVNQGIEDLEKKQVLMPITSESDIMVSQALNDPIPKSPVHFIPLHGLNYMGKLDGPVLINSKSKLVNSRLAPVLPEFFLEHFNFIEREPYMRPLMKPCGTGSTYKNPYNLALSKISCQKASLDSHVLNKVVNVLVDHLSAGLKGLRISPLDIETSINGADDDPFIRRINASTAPGFGFDMKKKEDYLPLVDDTTREAIPELKELLKEDLTTYQLGKANHFVYSSNLKDEPRLRSKVDAGKTRLFFKQGLDALIINRMFLSPFYTLMIEHGWLFCTSVGINMHSGADAMISRMHNFSPLFMEGDYGAYDQTMPFEIGHAASTVVSIMVGKLGYSKMAQVMVQNILSDNLFPLIEVNKDLFEAPGLQTSGKYATAEDNSLRGLILLMYAWYMHPELSKLHFFDYVMPNTYGDDIIATVKKEVSHVFNNVYYQEVCSRIFKMKYTSASKSDNVSTFLSIDEVSFLKRHFVYSERYARWIAPLEKASLYKSLNWLIPSRAVTEIEQTISTCVSFLWESFFHLDELDFNHMRNDLISILDERLELPEGASARVLPTYGDVRGRLSW